MTAVIRPASLSYRQADTANVDILNMAPHAFIYSNDTETPHLHALMSSRIQDMLQILKTKGLIFDAFSRDELPYTLENYQLVIAAGGDGTQLDAAIRISNTPLCGVRLLPEKSIGYLCKLDFDTFDAFIHRYLKHQVQLEYTPRLQCLIDDIPLPQPVLNDILIANVCPARATRFELAFRQQEAAFCSSGIWIATQPGSHGAAYAAGATPIPQTQQDLALYCVRECSPYRKTQTIPNSPDICSRFVPSQESPVIHIRDHNSMLYLDGGLVQHALKYGQKVTFKPHPNTLIRLF